MTKSSPRRPGGRPRLGPSRGRRREDHHDVADPALSFWEFARLLQECEDAELLVVERHRDAQLASIGLGALTRHLIDHAPCPVMITPTSDARDQWEVNQLAEPES
jgi:hypothetical protein